MLRVNPYRHHQATSAPLGLFDRSLFSPGTLLDEMNSIDATVKQLDRDVAGSQVAPDVKAAWSAFKEEWDKFYSSNTGFFGYFSRTLNVTSDKVAEYRRRLDDWRAKFQSSGGQSAAPALGPQAGAPPSTMTIFGLSLTSVGLIAVGAYAASKLLKRRG